MEPEGKEIAFEYADDEEREAGIRQWIAENTPTWEDIEIGVIGGVYLGVVS